MGSNHDEDGWDNEREAHSVLVPAFSIQKTPVTNGEWLAFIEAGGYDIDAHWSAAGRAWKRRVNAKCPLYWHEAGPGQWFERTLAGVLPLVEAAPVCHLSWYEAEAFARHAGARLPTECEWERVASDGVGEKLRFPWGNLAHEHVDWALNRCVRSAVGSFPQNASRSGVLDLVGGVWEWTEEVFGPYPGFTAQAYAGYSEPWFDGKHRVARGGSYVTEPELGRSTFRNWYPPEMRLPFLGLRLARGAA
jgi:iron(II)-dependent oxidoreductase